MDLPEELKQPLITRSVDETEALGHRLAAELAPDGLLLLFGDLGSGKTVLVRGLARALGLAAEEIQSPTYTLIHEHEGPRGNLVHLDLYRLEPEEIAPLGLDELLAGPGIKAVEWAERLPKELAHGGLELRLQARAEGVREIFLRRVGSP